MSKETSELRLDIEKGLDTIWELDDENSVRKHVSSINSLIVRTQMGPLGMSDNRIPLLETEEVVKQWREQH